MPRRPGRPRPPDRSAATRHRTSLAWASAARPMATTTPGAGPSLRSTPHSPKPVWPLEPSAAAADAPARRSPDTSGMTEQGNRTAGPADVPGPSSPDPLGIADPGERAGASAATGGAHQIDLDASEPVVDRTRSAGARALKARDETKRRVEYLRTRNALVDAALEAGDLDRRRAGSLLAGGIAFRIFLWLLPAALFAAAVVGLL